MKISMLASTRPREWFLEEDIKSIRVGMSQVRDHLILLNANPDFINLSSEAIEAMADLNSRDFLRDLVRTLPRSSKVPNVYVDVDVDSNESEKLDKLEIDGVLHSLVEERIRDARSGESRDEVFQRCLSVLASQALEIRITDSYAASSLLRGSENMWLLRKLLSESTAKVCIYSMPPAWAGKTKNQRQSIDPKIDLIEPILRYNLRSIEGVERQENGPLRLLIYETCYHNRRINFRFDNTSITLNLEKGIDTFSLPTLTEDMSFALRDSTNNFETRVKMIEKFKLLIGI
jgi:hypothetical protein